MITDDELEPEMPIAVSDDDEDALVPVEPPMEGEEELEPPLIYDEESPNLIEAFNATERGKLWLKDACARVREDWDREWEASETYRRRFSEDAKIFAGDLPELKDAPYEFCANVNVPIMLENLSRLQLRATGELFPDWNDVFVVTPIGGASDDIAEALTKHGNWQIRQQIPNFKREIGHRGMLFFFLNGDVTCRSYYDPRTKLNCHEILTPDDFVTPFAHSSTQPDYSDLPWYAYRIQRYRHQLEAEADTWHGVSDLLANRTPQLSDEPHSPAVEEMAKLQGKEMDDSSPSAPYQLICWEGWMSIPPSEDDPTPQLAPPEDESKELEPRQRFLKIVIEYETLQPMQVQIYEIANWQEKARFKQQSQELDGYRTARGEHDAFVAQHQENVSQQEMMLSSAESVGELGALQAATARQSLDALAATPMPPPPTPPAWLMNPDDPFAQPEKPRKDPIRLLSHGVCIESLVGSLGLSYGRILSDINKGANIVFNQFIDSATLANIKTLLAAGGVDLGNLVLKPGQVNMLQNLPGTIKDALIELEFPPANPQMIEILKLLLQFGQESVQSPNILSGQPGKSGETYRGVAARIEQATKQLSVLTQKYQDFVDQILKNNALLNSFHLRDEELFMINNELLGFAENVKISRSYYERNYMLEFRSDLRFSPQTQKVAEADELVRMSMEIPVLIRNPDFQYHAVIKALKARGHFDMVKMMGPPPSVVMQQQAARAAALGLPPPGMQPQPGQPGQPQPGQPQRPRPQQPPKPQPS